MTFIASVIAKDGIAVIADSLVTSQVHSLPEWKWEHYIKNKKEGLKEGEDFKLAEEEITDLFELKPSHTKDYENKLLVYDEKKALITTAGGAVINGKKISKIITEIRDRKTKNGEKKPKTIEEKVKSFCDFLEMEATEHFKKKGRIAVTTLIYSSYFNSQAAIYKITISNKNKGNPFVEWEKQNDIVICDGQSGIAYRILYGGILDGLNWFNNTLESLKVELKKLGIVEGDKLPATFFEDFRASKSSELIQKNRDELKLYRLNNLSLQQASDLAYLLLKVERDFQVYTENIPTVGGHIKLAVINDSGVHWVLGEDIIKPTDHL